MKKTIAITEECNQLLKELAEKNDTTESKIVTNGLIINYKLFLL